MRLALGAVLLGGLAVWAATSLRVTAGLTHFLPEQDQQLGQLSRALATSPMNRTLVLNVGGAGAAQAAGQMADTLATHPGVAAVIRGPEPALERAFHDLYFPRRLLFFSVEPERDWARLGGDAGLRQAAQDLLAELRLPTGALVKKLAPSDPLLTFPRLLERLEARRPGLAVVDGQFMAGDHAVIFVDTHADAMDGDAQAAVLGAVQAAFESARPAHPAITLQMSGVGRIAQASRESVKADVTRISALSILGVVALFLALFRSVRLLLVGLLPLGAAALAGAAATQAVYGQVHGLTLAAGATLIGVCLDYPIHYFNHHLLAPAQDPEATMRRVQVGLGLGALTTVTGFVGLAWTTYPGIREISVFTAAGVVAALAVTRWMLPALVPRPAPVPALTRLQARLSSLLQTRSVALPIAAALVAVAGLPLAQFEDDPAALNAVDPALMAEDQAVRARVARVEPGRLVVSLADDEQTALERAFAVDQAVENTWSIATFLWPESVQRRNWQAIPAGLADGVDAAFTEAGFRPGTFAPFRESLAASPEPLTYADLAASPLARLVRPFRVQVGDQVGYLTFLQGGADPTERIAGIEGTFFFDQRAFLSGAVGEWRARAVELVLVGAALVLLLVGLRYRRLGATLIAAAPAFLACLATVGALSLAFVQLTVPHLIALILVFSMGVDYGVFLAESDRGGHLSATLVSIVIACASTVLAFGLLALSANPALRAIGLTVGLGVLLCMVLAPAVRGLVRA